ncbi:MAG: alpha/beta fold hydrolase [Oceanospirillaceae bacterium]|nr:alpha/beta fold hydrolase [Oceanospirillaceae bacterium]
MIALKKNLPSVAFNRQPAGVRTMMRIVNRIRNLATGSRIKLKTGSRVACCLSLIMGLTACVKIPKTIEFDDSLSYTEINGYKFHTQIVGDPDTPTVIVVHGGPGGDYGYLKSLAALSQDHRVIFYDQRGSGLSPRETKNKLTLEQNLADLHAIIQHFSAEQQVKLIGHSWGGMLVTGYLSAHPEKVSQAVIVEPGMLYPESAQAFVAKMKESQSISSLLALARYMLAYPLVSKNDGHEGFDYVLTKLYNRSTTDDPFQCAGESMPPNSFSRGGYAAFNNMLKPVMDDATTFSYDLTAGISQYNGDLLLISSECSQFGFAFQEKYHLPKLPRQTVHLKAENMGHYMLTLNPQWSLSNIGQFFGT